MSDRVIKAPLKFKSPSPIIETTLGDWGPWDCQNCSFCVSRIYLYPEETGIPNQYEPFCLIQGDFLSVGTLYDYDLNRIKIKGLHASKPWKGPWPSMEDSDKIFLDPWTFVYLVCPGRSALEVLDITNK